jgi:anti-anti-sigma factor
MDVSSLGERLVKVTIVGRLDTQGVGKIETRFTAALVPAGTNAIVDLSQVEFVASLGIRMLLSAAQGLKKRNATLAVYGAPERVRQVFEAVSLGKILPVCATESEALAAVGGLPRV